MLALNSKILIANIVFMDFFLTFILEYSLQFEMLVFGLILLAGLNVPIPLDVVVIGAGVYAATQTSPYPVFYFFGWTYLACIISAWASYWIGRLLGPRVFQMRWFKGAMPQERLEKIQRFFSRYGLLTLIIGRFIPFGVRNCLFMSAGISHMPFKRFIARDAFACFLSTSLQFYLGYTFGKNSALLYEYLGTYRLVIGIFLLLVLAIALIFWYVRRKRKKNISS